MSLLDNLQRIGTELWYTMEKELKPKLEELDRLQKNLTREGAKAALEVLDEITGELHRVVKETREKVEKESEGEDPPKQ
ncbi:MAG: hypothetical protein Q8R40_01410 [bacterium]|nr:hypothetical protein [bacterium]